MKNIEIMSDYISNSYHVLGTGLDDLYAASYYSLTIPIRGLCYADFSDKEAIT